MIDLPWTKGYADLEAKTFGDPSAEILELANQMVQGAKVLDLGCGEGRNALFLAKQGFDVTAVDISESGIRKLQMLADRDGISIRADVADMRQYSFSGKFDLIVSHGCLHLIARKQWMKLVSEFKSHTIPGGTNVVVVFTDRIPPPADLEAHCLGLFQEGKLFSLYEDWDIELEESYTIEDEHPGSIRHTHPINKAVARKPLNQTTQLTGQGTGD